MRRRIIHFAQEMWHQESPGSPLFVKDGVFDRYANKLFSERLTDINSAKYEKVAPRDAAETAYLFALWVMDNKLDEVKEIVG